MKYEVIVIGGGLAGLTAAALLAKRGVHVALIDKNYNPGGSCGIFKRNGAIFDQGSAMLYGFGEKGFNSHRFVFNCLEEPIDIIRHDLLYCVNFNGKRIKFPGDIGLFTEELAKAFPDERENIKRFYGDMEKLYRHVMVENPNYTTPDETDPKEALKSLLQHPVSYARFLGFLNKNAGELLRKYFKGPDIFKFFNKLTSTYCYTTVEESPAVLAAVMFIDNHVGGSYYPAGSTIFLPGRLEKAIEENGGEMLLEKEVTGILFEGEKPSGVELADGSRLYADYLIYAGSVWPLYEKLIDKSLLTKKELDWVAALVPTYPSVVYYAQVDGAVIPADTQPVEMLVGNPDSIDESEVTVYIPSIDDKTLCDPGSHVLAAIGPSFEVWDHTDEEGYSLGKLRELARLEEVLERRFPGFAEAVRYEEVATPWTIERYTCKKGGAVAGPKQMLGQHMLNRLHTRTRWENLFCCGESTVLGTGTPAVTTSGLSAANAVLKRLGLEIFKYRPDMKNYVRITDRPFTRDMLYTGYPEEERNIMLKAAKCWYCEKPGCSENLALDIRGIMRRVTVGNLIGARAVAARYSGDVTLTEADFTKCEKACLKYLQDGKSVEIKTVIDYVLNYPV
ncbi:MAG: FAD-dependent oxidoreductase [Clostridiales bacterium]|nr:FAD-dependent oxidoreductase [Clostridiales bacterium]